MIDFSKLHYNGEHDSVFTRSPRGSVHSPYYEGGGSQSGNESMKDELNEED